MTERWINGLAGGIGLLARAVKGAVKAIKDGAEFSYIKFAVSVVQALIVAIAEGYIVPDPYTALIGGYLAGNFLDGVGLQKKD